MLARKRFKIIICLVLCLSIFVVQTNHEIQEAKAVVWLAPVLWEVAGSLLVSAGITFASNQALMANAYSFLTRYGAPVVNAISTYGVGAVVNVTSGLNDALNDFVNWVKGDGAGQTVNYNYGYMTPQMILDNKPWSQFNPTTIASSVSFNLSGNSSSLVDLWTFTVTKDGTSYVYDVKINKSSPDRLRVYYMGSQVSVSILSTGGFSYNAADQIFTLYNLTVYKHHATSMEVAYFTGTPSSYNFLVGSSAPSFYSANTATITHTFTHPYFKDGSTIVTDAGTVLSGSGVLGQDVVYQPQAGTKDLTGVDVKVLPGADVLGKTASDVIANSVPADLAQSNAINNALVGKIGFGPLKLSMQKLQDFNIGASPAPVIKINLGKIFNASVSQIAPGVASPFANQDTIFFDFGTLENYQFGGMNLVEYFRMITGAGMIYTTFLYCWRKIVPSEVVN